MGLIAGRPSEENIPTAELPKPDLEPEAEPEQLTEQELEITTADTRPLPPEMAEALAAEPKTDEAPMDSKVTQTANTASELTARVSGPLLDLGDFEPAHAAAEEDFVLDLDLDEVPEAAPVAGSFASHGVTDQEFGMVEVVESVAVVEPLEPTADPMAETQEMMRPILESAPQAVAERAFAEPEILETEMLPTPGGIISGIGGLGGIGAVTPEQLSPEAIDAIARRAVEMLSEKAVQEIAWEVVPQLAELMIKRQLEEKNS